MLLSRKHLGIKQGLPVKKKVFLTVAFHSILLFSAVVGTQFVNIGKANPNPFAPWTIYKGEVSPIGLSPPEISITSPKNNTICTENSLNLTLSVSVEPSSGDTTRFMQEIIYKVDWLPQNKTVYKFIASRPPATYEEAKSYIPTPTINEFSSDISLKDVPEGKRSIVVFAIERGSYTIPTSEKIGLHPVINEYSFNVSSSSSVTFTVDTVPPEIQILQMHNKTYTDSNALLNFTVNEPVWNIWYVLDGKERVTISENVTLSGLINGEHNVTVYATDLAGHIGASETVYFSVEAPETFQTTTVVVPVASVAVVGAGLLVYFKKRKR
jgi:hypothetical protein